MRMPMMEAGFPLEAMHEGARVYSDALRKLTDAEVSMVQHVFTCVR